RLLDDRNRRASSVPAGAVVAAAASGPPSTGAAGCEYRLPPRILIRGGREPLPYTRNPVLIRSTTLSHSKVGRLLRSLLMTASMVVFGAVRLDAGYLGGSNQTGPSDDQSWGALPGNYQLPNGRRVGIDLFRGDDGTLSLLYADYRSGIVRRLFSMDSDRFAMGPGFPVPSPPQRSVRAVRENGGTADGSRCAGQESGNAFRHECLCNSMKFLSQAARPPLPEHCWFHPETVHILRSFRSTAQGL